MKISALFIIVFSLFFAVSCTKQTQAVVEELGDTTGQIVSDKVEENVAPSDSALILQQEINTGDYSSSYEGDGRNINIEFKGDAEGNPVAVLSEKGKDLWIYQTSMTNEESHYQDKEKGIQLKVKGNFVTLTENGKIYSLRAVKK